MDPVASISSSAPELKSQDFAFLRSEGIELLQRIASTTWTDHNLSDPGITLLESVCYALTEMGLRAGMEIRDLVASDVSGVTQSFHSAAEILPVAPVRIRDFRKILINHPLIRNASLFTLAPTPAGRFRVLLEFADDDLNSNTFGISVTPALLASTYQVDLAFPHWDEESVLPFNEDVVLQNAVFDGAPGSEWHLISGSDAYFSRLTVTYQPSVGGPQTTELWIVAQINTQLDNPVVEVPPILADVSTEIATIGDNSAADQTLLKRLNRRISSAHASIEIVRQFLNDYRNLCEDFDRFQAVRSQEIAVSAIIEVNQGVILEDLLAEIFLSIDGLISPHHAFESLTDLRLRLPSEDIFEGPLLESGFLADDSLRTQEHSDIIYSSDILRLILRLRDEAGRDVLEREDLSLRNIVAVRNLALSNYLDNRPITSNARDCLQLVDSHRHVPRLSLTKSRIVFYRGGVEVDYDLDRVIEIFEDTKAAALAGQVPGTADLPIPRGDDYPVGEYYPIQNDLPLIYGVGEAGLPERASEERRALALQLKGYLFFFEQLTAGLAGQLAHFNAFFSTDPEQEQTLFPTTLYHLARVESILKSFDPAATSWEAFQNDPQNGYVSRLRLASESHDEFLRRRNRVLDHLLAVLGEDMRDKAALESDRASVVQNSAGLSLTDLVQIQAEQRNAASRQLIRQKASFLDDLPALNRDRAQSFGNPVWRAEGLLQLQPIGGSFDWSLLDGDAAPLFRASAPAGSAPESQRSAAEALSLGRSDTHYAIVVEPSGQHRLELRPAAASAPVAESEATYNTAPLALAAIPDHVDAVIRLWLRHAFTPLEHRLYHMLGLEIKERRQLLRPVGDFFEVFDDVPDPNNEKLFRLWSLPGFAGDDLLTSEDNYPGLTDAAAIAAALAEIDDVIERGLVADNYVIENPAPNTFEVVLLRADGTVVARSSGSFTNRELAEEGARRIRRHLFRMYSAQGLYLVEHLLLHPRQAADADLSVEEILDPYSFQISLVLPSGYARDFSVPGSVRQPARPHAYRDPEYRKYVELQARKACPAHILPRIVWVDRVLPGSAISPLDPSFDAFEGRYLAWLEAWFVDRYDEAVVGPLRNDLVQILNAIYQDAT